MTIFSNRGAAAAAALLLAGCATPQQTASLECGVGGAAVGYLACKALGHSDATCARTAAVGGGIGAAACYSYADRLARRKQELAGRENDLDARLRYVRGLNEDGQKLNAELRDRVAVATQRSTELAQQVRQKSASAQVLAQERERLDRELKAANDQVSAQRDALREVKTYQARRTSPDLDAEIAKQDRLLAEAQHQVGTLASLRERAAGATS